jgi:hypothetical protein
MPPRPSTGAKCNSSSPIDPVKTFLLSLAAAALCLATACERISPSVSIPGYEEKKAAEAKAEARTLGATENPPEFFPTQGQE